MSIWALDLLFVILAGVRKHLLEKDPEALATSSLPKRVWLDRSESSPRQRRILHVRPADGLEMVPVDYVCQTIR